MEVLSCLEAAGSAFLAPLNGVAGWGDDGPVVLAACCYDTALFDESLFGSLGLVQPEQLQRAVAKRKAEFLAGRYCARRALARLGLPDARIGIGGQRQPLWPGGVRGAISHTRQLAMAAVSRDASVCGVGVDVEEVLTPAAMVQIQPLVLNADECDLLSRVRWPRESLVTLIYSIKESFFKAAFPLVQRYFDFDAISLLEIDTGEGECHFRINTALHPLLWQGRRLSGRFRFFHCAGLAAENVATRVILADR
ncbi:MAG: 4'-phosphopantetheinyl transferase [Parahaliea sp.]